MRFEELYAEPCQKKLSTIFGAGEKTQYMSAYLNLPTLKHSSMNLFSFFFLLPSIVFLATVTSGREDRLL